jgi:hypothetical protein
MKQRMNNLLTLIAVGEAATGVAVPRYSRRLGRAAVVAGGGVARCPDVVLGAIQTGEANVGHGATTKPRMNARAVCTP